MIKYWTLFLISWFCFSYSEYFVFWREEVPENVLQQYRFQILRWLEDKENKMEVLCIVWQLISI